MKETTKQIYQENGRTSNNLHLNAVLRDKDSDEFYTMYDDIKAELDNYDFTGLKVVCPCDGEESNFVKYFKDRGVDFDYFAGDYESVDYDKYDVVVTNPPFRNYRKFFELIEHKKFIVIMPLANMTHPWCMKAILEQGCSVGYTGRIQNFVRPDGSIQKLGNTMWFTNMNLNRKPFKELPTGEGDIRILDDGRKEVNKIKNIPEHFDGELLVPVTIMEYTPLPNHVILGTAKNPKFNGKNVFKRVVITCKN